MGSKAKEGKASRLQTPLIWDAVTYDRLTKQAARRHGTKEGYRQDYIRAAVMKQLERDEADSERSAAEAGEEVLA